jgi:hypothetical protein
MASAGFGLGLTAAALGTLLAGGAVAAEDAAPATQAPIARLAVEFRDVEIERVSGEDEAGGATANGVPDLFEFRHRRAFIESGGVGVTLTAGQVCWAADRCLSNAVSYRIDANGTLLVENQLIRATTPQQTFAYTYLGTDDNGHQVELSFKVLIDGPRFEVTP